LMVETAATPPAKAHGPARGALACNSAIPITAIPGSVARRFENDPVTTAFVSDLSEVIDQHQPALWIHGHTHDCFDYRVGATRIACNPEDYGLMKPGRRIEYVAFDVGMVVEI